MAASNKRFPSGANPLIQKTIANDSPDSFYSMRPAWRFCMRDLECWSLSHECVHDLWWSDILPRLSSFETMTWAQILVENKKNNHRISAPALNQVAVKRLSALPLELEAIYSLRVNGTHRLYGYIVDGVFHIVWYDMAHGDNNRCVCRSYLKHT